MTEPVSKSSFGTGTKKCSYPLSGKCTKLLCSYAGCLASGCHPLAVYWLAYRNNDMMAYVAYV